MKRKAVLRAALGVCLLVLALGSPITGALGQYQEYEFDAFMFCPPVDPDTMLVKMFARTMQGMELVWTYHMVPVKSRNGDGCEYHALYEGYMPVTEGSDRIKAVIRQQNGPIYCSCSRTMTWGPEDVYRVSVWGMFSPYEDPWCTVTLYEQEPDPPVPDPTPTPDWQFVHGR